MAAPSNLRNLLLGSAIFIEDESKYKRALLTGQISLLGVGISVFYIFFDNLAGITDTWSVYLIGVFVFSGNILILRRKIYWLPKHILLITANLLIYLFAAREPYGTGAHLLFFATLTVAFALFDYRFISYAYVYAGITLVFFVSSQFSDFSILPKNYPEEEVTRINFLANSIIASLASIFNIIFLIRINRKSEAKLHENEGELKKVMSELQESNTIFELAVQGANGGIWDWNIKDNTVFNTARWKRMLGYEENELDSMTLEGFLEMIHPGDRKIVEEKVQNHLQRKEPYFTEFRIKTKAGKYRWVVDSGQAVWEEDGTPIRMVGSIVDITQRKIAEQRVRNQNKILAKTNAELDRFVYSTSHDLRAPLMSILGLINISEKESSVKELRLYTAMIRSRVEKLDTFIKDIINYSRNTRVEVSADEVNVHDMVADIIQNLQYIEGFENVNFIIRIDKDQIVITDESRLKVVLNNLISNALKYRKEVESYVLIEMNKIDGGVEITVEDNGEGIREELKDKIFDMFYRASEKSEGSGLGLYIVKEMVEKQGGSIKVDSVLDEGTKFIIELPAKVVEPETSKASTST